MDGNQPVDGLSEKEFKKLAHSIVGLAVHAINQQRCPSSQVDMFHMSLDQYRATHITIEWLKPVISKQISTLNAEQLGFLYQEFVEFAASFMRMLGKPVEENGVLTYQDKATDRGRMGVSTKISLDIADAIASRMTDIGAGCAFEWDTNLIKAAQKHQELANKLNNSRIIAS